MRVLRDREVSTLSVPLSGGVANAENCSSHQDWYAQQREKVSAASKAEIESLSFSSPTYYY